MTDVFSETMRNWQNFYFMIGGAAAALLGLMFVALSMGMHLVDRAPLEVFRAFVTPSVTYFVSILLVSGVMLVPVFTPTILAVVLVAGGVFGLAKTFRPVIKLIEAARKHQDFNIGDWLSQIIMPLASYFLILAAGIGIAVDQASLAFGGIWLATLFLLICAIANTWTLVMWIIGETQG